MNLKLRRADDFVGDFENPYRWYFDEAGEAVARRFLEAVWRALELLAAHPGWVQPADFANRSFWVFDPSGWHHHFTRT